MILGASGVGLLIRLSVSRFEVSCSALSIVLPTGIKFSDCVPDWKFNSFYWKCCTCTKFIVLLPFALTWAQEEEGFLTPTKKIKRSVVEKAFQKQIEMMYTASDTYVRYKDWACHESSTCHGLCPVVSWKETESIPLTNLTMGSTYVHGAVDLFRSRLMRILMDKRYHLDPFKRSMSCPTFGWQSSLGGHFRFWIFVWRYGQTFLGSKVARVHQPFLLENLLSPFFGDAGSIFGFQTVAIPQRCVNVSGPPSVMSKSWPDCLGTIDVACKSVTWGSLDVGNFLGFSAGTDIFTGYAHVCILVLRRPKV